MMKKFLLLTASALASVGFASAALAALTAQDLVTAYQNDGFTAIEVTTGVTQIKVEAVKDGAKLEVVYDIESGTILSSEQKRAKAKDAADTSVEIQTSATDFTDDSAEDDGQGHGSDDHSGGNSGSGSDDGDGHDAGDDHGGSDHSGHGGGEGSDD